MEKKKRLLESDPNVFEDEWSSTKSNDSSILQGKMLVHEWVPRVTKCTPILQAPVVRKVDRAIY